MDTDVNQINTDITDKGLKRASRLSVVFVIICVLSVLICAPKAQAQTFSLGIYPPLLEVMIMPGKSITQEYQLSNSGDETEITAQIVTFKPADELGNISLETLGEKDWFSFENTGLALGQPFTLKPGQTKQLVLKIKIPQDEAEDDYYFTLLFTSQPQEKIGKSSGTETMGVIGANILITVSKDGKPPKKGEIEEFILKNFPFSIFHFPIIDSFDKPEFLLKIKNTSRTFWKPFGKIKTEGLIGQKWEQEIRPDNVLANSIRQIQVATPSASPNFLLGPYRAKAQFTPDEDGQTIEAYTSFFALPIRTLIAFVFITILTVFGKRMFGHKRKKKAGS